MANSLTDTLNPPDYIQIGTANMTGSLTGSSIYNVAGLSGAQIGSGGLGIQHMNAIGGDVTAFTDFAAVKMGSPAAGGRFIQAGSAALSAGSAAWVVFGTPFGAAPQVTVANYSNILGIFVAAGSINAGSFYAEGATASSVFGWHAIGSG